MQLFYWLRLQQKFPSMGWSSLWKSFSHTFHILMLQIRHSWKNMFFFQNLPWGTKGKNLKERIFFQEWRWRNFLFTFLESTLKMDLETINLSSVWFGVGCNTGWVTSGVVNSQCWTKFYYYCCVFIQIGRFFLLNYGLCSYGKLFLEKFKKQLRNGQRSTLKN